MVGRPGLPPLHGLKENSSFTVCRILEAYPANKIYLLEQKHPRSSRAEAISLVRGKLLEYLRNESHLKLEKGL